MNSLLRHLKRKLVSGKWHPASLRRKKYNNTQYFAKFSLFFESFATKKLTRKQVKISHFIVM